MVAIETDGGQKACGAQVPEGVLTSVERRHHERLEYKYDFGPTLDIDFALNCIFMLIKQVITNGSIRICLSIPICLTQNL